jgi:hypothetical protein
MLTNQTPLSATTKLHRDHLGRSYVLVIAKGCWRISTGRFAPAEQQVGLHQQPLRMRLSELELDAAQLKAIETRQDEEIIWLDHDITPPKPAFDVIVAGYITAPANYQSLQIQAGLRIGQHTAGMRAYVPRYWQRILLHHTAKHLTPIVHRVPITYAVADWSQGFSTSPPEGHVAWLPWIEDLQQPSKHGKHSKKPAGLGFWPENAAQRQSFAGTYDDQWQRETSPNLPADFDPRFYNCAHPDAQLPQAPSGGTAIRLAHLSHNPLIDCRFPTLTLSAKATSAAGKVNQPVQLQADTLTIEPDQDRLSVVWRALLPNGTSTNAVRNVQLFRVDGVSL